MCVVYHVQEHPQSIVIICEIVMWFLNAMKKLSKKLHAAWTLNMVLKIRLMNDYKWGLVFPRSDFKTKWFFHSHIWDFGKVMFFTFIKMITDARYQAIKLSNYIEFCAACGTHFRLSTQRPNIQKQNLILSFCSSNFEF